MLDYAWPGNVRELQHCVLRAVLTHEAAELDDDAIELYPETPDKTDLPTDRMEPRFLPAAAALLPDPAGPAPAVTNPWEVLALELDRQVTAAVEQDHRRPVPIGRWLTEDLVLAANELCNHVARRAAQLVGVPESTFRRQLQKVTAGKMTGTNYRPENWATMRPKIRRIVEHTYEAKTAQGNLLERARDALLDCVQSKTAVRPAAGACLMGVTPPTYKRWLKAREAVS